MSAPKQLAVGQAPGTVVRVGPRELEAEAARLAEFRHHLDEEHDPLAVWMLDTRVRRIKTALWRLRERPDHWRHVDLSELLEPMPEVEAHCSNHPRPQNNASPASTM